MKIINRNEIIESVVRMACDSKRIDWWIVKDVLDSLDFVIYQYLNDSLAREPYEDNILPLGKNKIYDLLNSGQIKSIKIGKKYIIPKNNVIEFLQSA